MLKNKLLIPLFAFAIALFGVMAFAQNANAVAVSPVLIEHELAPGMNANGKIRVTNLAEKTQTYYVESLRFVPIGEEGRQEYIDPEDDVTSFSDWFSFEQSSYDIQGKSTLEIDYTLAAPLNAEPGGHYGAVFFSLDPPQTGEKFVGSRISSKTGVLFLIKIAGDITEQANIESFTTDKKVYSHLPTKFNLRIKNTGNVHFRPKGTLEVRNMWGSIVARVPVNPSKSAVLPNSIRKVNTWWAKSNQLAKGGFIAGLSNEWHNFGLGRYSAKVNATYGSQNKPFAEQEVSFWVLPWRMILILAILLIVLYIGIRAYNKAIVSSAVNKSNKKSTKK